MGKDNIVYKCEYGTVLGDMWGGGQGFYPTSKIEGNTEKEIIKNAEKMLEDGSLDSGFGFEGLNGALITISSQKIIEKDGEQFFSEKDYNDIVIGKLSEQEQERAIEVIAYQ